MKEDGQGRTFLPREGFPPHDKNQKWSWELGHREQSIKKGGQTRCKGRVLESIATFCWHECSSSAWAAVSWEHKILAAMGASYVNPKVPERKLMQFLKRKPCSKSSWAGIPGLCETTGGGRGGVCVKKCIYWRPQKSWGSLQLVTGRQEFCMPAAVAEREGGGQTRHCVQAQMVLGVRVLLSVFPSPVLSVLSQQHGYIHLCLWPACAALAVAWALSLLWACLPSFHGVYLPI